MAEQINRCERCRHSWNQKGVQRPRTCPRCGSPYWDVPKKLDLNSILIRHTKK